MTKSSLSLHSPSPSPFPSLPFSLPSLPFLFPPLSFPLPSLPFFLLYFIFIDTCYNGKNSRKYSIQNNLDPSSSDLCNSTNKSPTMEQYLIQRYLALRYSHNLDDIWEVFLCSSFLTKLDWHRLLWIFISLFLDMEKNETKVGMDPQVWSYPSLCHRNVITFLLILKCLFGMSLKCESESVDFATFS